MEATKPYKYEDARNLLRDILDDFRILAGDKAGNGATWQDVAGTCATNLEVLAAKLHAARRGFVAGGPVVFPSPDDLEDSGPDSPGHPVTCRRACCR